MVTRLIPIDNADPNAFDNAAVRAASLATWIETVTAVVTDKAATPGGMALAPSGGDDTTEIQARIAAGRTTQLTSGTYLASADLIPAAGCTIAGAPDGTTIIKLTGTNRGFNITNIPGVTLRDLTIDCDKANTADRGDTTQTGVYIVASDATGCPRTRLERVTILDAWDRGVSAKATTLDTHPLEIELIDVTISGCGLQAVYIEKATRSRVTRGGYSTSLYGVQIAGGRNAIIDGADAYDNVDHGIVTNTGISDVKVINNHCWGNGSTNDWGIVVGTDATRFVVAGNVCYDNAGGITVDVATAGSPIPVDTRGVISDNVCTGNSISDGLHVNQADGLTITGNNCSHNEQTGMSLFGRNFVVEGNIAHHNGRNGIAFEEDGVDPETGPCGPHIYGTNLVYDNNQNAGAWVDFFVDTLTNGGVLDKARTGDALPANMPAGHFVQLCPSPMTTAVITNGSAYSLPFDIAEPQAFDQLLFEVVTTPGSAGSVCRGVICYDDGTGRRPGRIYQDLGTVATETTGVKALTISGTFKVGRYWADIIPQGAPTTNPTLRLVTCPHVRMATTALATLAQEFLLTTGVTGAMPDPHTTVNSTNTLSISMALRAA